MNDGEVIRGLGVGDRVLMERRGIEVGREVLILEKERGKGRVLKGFGDEFRDDLGGEVGLGCDVEGGDGEGGVVVGVWLVEVDLVVS